MDIPGWDLRYLEPFVSVEVPSERLPITTKLQEAVVESLDEHDATPVRLVAELLSTTAYLEIALEEAKSAIRQLDSLCVNVISYVVSMESRLAQAGLPPDFDRLEDLTAAAQQKIDF